MVVPIELPPLRERAEDIPELVEHFFARCKTKHAREELTLPHSVLRRLCTYHWPGNVRQLENAIERIVLLARGSEISLQDLPDFLQQTEAASDVLPSVLPETGMNLGEMEKELILRTLRKFGGNQSRAANFLQLSRRTLAYRLEKYGISASDFVRAPKEIAG
jgi:two-component system NtrC family response regulator